MMIYYNLYHIQIIIKKKGTAKNCRKEKYDAQKSMHYTELAMKNMLVKIGSGLDDFNRTLELVTGLVIFGFMMLLCFQVIMRYVFSRPIYGIDEVVTGLMIWCCSMAWGTVYWQNGHAILEFIVKRLPKKAREVIFNAINVLVVVISACYLPGSWKLFQLQLKQAPVGGLPFCKAYYYALPVFVMSILLMVYSIYKLTAYFVLRDDSIVAPAPSEEGNAID